MPRLLTHPVEHCLGLLLIGVLVFFPNLGSPSLWDIDESHNAECAREMLEAGDYVVPTFNFRLRTDKPPLQYWVLILSYQLFGVSEFAARFGSALCGIGIVLLTYWLARRMFDGATGFLAGLILATSVMFCVSAHAVTPDAFLILLTSASFLLVWWGHQSGSTWWLVGFGLTTGLAVLAKGPVGLVLPFATNLLFLLWERRWRDLWDWRMVAGCAFFGLVTLPWYILVGSETKWAFWEGFFLKHNLQRFQTPLEGHRGPFFYHPLALIAAFAPWSCFLGLTVWYSTGSRARRDGAGTADESARLPAAYRFLWCWIAVWMVFFSAASTKLPNYVLPCYPALAILTARFLVRWQGQAIQIPRSLMAVGLGCLALVGLVVGAGLLVASGAVPGIPLRGREFPELGPWSVLGLIPPTAAVAAGYWLYQGQRKRVLVVVSVAALGFVAVGAAFLPEVVDEHKVHRPFAAAIAEHQTERDVRIGCYRFYQPGLVFYTKRPVEVLRQEQDAIDHLRSPLQSFLVLPGETWERLRGDVDVPTEVVARKHDYQTGKEIVLVINRPCEALASLPLP
jgi:4-amino-4-deoxy-L-arabinose transferase-like glycosyltransferase